jgi:hypothetical protein
MVHGWQYEGFQKIPYFMSMIFLLIQIKFDIDVNNDELLETIWEHEKKEKKLIFTCSVQEHGPKVF